MARIQVQIDEVRNDNYLLPSLVSKLDSCEKEMAVLRWRMPVNVEGMDAIREELQNTKRELGAIREKIDALYRITNDCMNQYAEVERQNEAHAQDFQ